MSIVQLTWDTYDKPMCVKANEPCNHSECLEAQDTKCCSGCRLAYTCTSRCIRSYRFVTEDRELLKRHIGNGLPVGTHNCGQLLCDHRGKPYAIVLNK